jgi:hypothetical protein
MTINFLLGVELTNSNICSTLKAVTFFFDIYLN